MRVLVAMSGGVDSSVAAAMLAEAGHEVTGVTMRLWGGESDSGCCSVSDVDDARRVAQQLGIDHWVFNFSDDFDAHVVEPYVAAHAGGETPNPCIECNRHLKFDRLLHRAVQLGFDAVATGHHVRRAVSPDGRFALRRAVDRNKDQSYVLSMLDQGQLARCLFPIGEIDKAEVRALAGRLALRTADKPDSQDVCFIAARSGGRTAFLSDRLALRPGRVVDAHGTTVGSVDAVQLVTIGQRKGLRVSGQADARFVLDVDVAEGTVVVGGHADLETEDLLLRDVTFVDEVVDGEVLVQSSAHGAVAEATLVLGHGAADRGGPGRALVRFARPQRRVAPGQTVAFYRGDDVVGAGIVTRA